MTNTRDDGEADDIAKQEAESVADAKRRLAKRSGTNPRDDSEAVATELWRWARAYRDGPREYRFPSDPDCEFFPPVLERGAETIASLSRQLAEAQVEIERMHKAFAQSCSEDRMELLGGCGLEISNAMATAAANNRAMLAEEQLTKCKMALEQAIDDFGDGYCVCEETKQLCIAALRDPDRQARR